MGKHVAPRTPRGFYRDLERLRAENIAQTVASYWAVRGHIVRTRIIREDPTCPEDPHHCENYKHGLAVRTNLVNGLPQ